MKKIAVTTLIIFLFTNFCALAARNYPIKYAYPNKIKKMSIYDFFKKGKPKAYSKSKYKKNYSKLKDKTSPRLISSSPKSASSNVNINSNIYLNFSENIKQNNLKNIYLKENNQNISIKTSIKGKQIIIHPSLPLKYDKIYTLYVGKGAVKDYSNNENSSFSINFRTEKGKINNTGSGNSTVINNKDNNSSNSNLKSQNPFTYILYDNKSIVKKYDYTKDREYLFFSDIKDISSIKDLKFDENKIPLADYNGYKYNPLLIAQYGLQNYNYYIRYNDREKLNNAVKAADYLLQNIDSSGKWINNFDYKYNNVNLKAPWSSSLTQGLGISLLIRIYEETKNIKYLDTAKKALEPLLKSSNEGGLYKNYYGHALYDIFPSDTKLTLSSHCFVILSLYDISKYDNRAKEKFEDSLYTLKDLIWIFSNSLDSFYKDIHNCQMEAIYSIIKTNNLDEYLEDFKLINIE
ncbi:MAG: D-glucuronyl C5-epimerase family protein [Caloramator sp.]|nr:D-glucuronyl C5-epimerase family protein [Caloramator sp.]